MAVVGDKVFVPANSKVLILENGNIAETIAMEGTVTGVIKSDEEGYVWVSCSTSPAQIIKLSATDYTMEKHTLTEGGVSAGWGATPAISAKGDEIYFCNNTSTIYRHTFSTNTTETLGDVKPNVVNWGIIYNMPAVHPVTGEYYYNTILATAGVSSRTISRYTTSIRIRPQWLQTTRTTRTSPPESISRPDSNPVISSGNSGSSPYLSAGNRSFRFSDIVQSGTHRDCQTVEAMVPQRKTVLHLLLNDTTQLNISWVVSSSVPGAGQPYLLRPFRYGNKFQCLCNLLIMACYQKYALFINFWFCIWFCIRLSDKERMDINFFIIAVY